MKIRFIIAIISFLILPNYIFGQEYKPMQELAGSKTKIAYIQVNDEKKRSYDIVVMDVATTKKYFIAPINFDYCKPMFNPDGNSLLFLKDASSSLGFDPEYEEDYYQMYKADFKTGGINCFQDSVFMDLDYNIVEDGFYYYNGDSLSLLSFDGKKREGFLVDTVYHISDICPERFGHLIMANMGLGGVHYRDSININYEQVRIIDPIAKTNKVLFSSHTTIAADDFKKGEIILRTRAWGPESSEKYSIYNIHTGRMRRINDVLFFNGLLLKPWEPLFYDDNRLLIVCEIEAANKAYDIFIYDLNQNKITKQLTFDGLFKCWMTIYEP